MTELPVPIGTVIAGRYRLDRVLGAGTMGVVAAAFHLDFEQAVAIKFVNPAALGEVEVAERFRREVRAAAKIKGEHVARVLDVGALDSGLPYVVMELLDGRTLEQELEARGCLPLPEAVEYVLHAIEALAEAHAAGIVHRDLKPANLFVARRADRSRVIKVLDFGVSKSLGESESNGLCLTRTGMIVGSPLYMSPEQLGGSKSVDVRCDVWALGAILFELLTGRTPYSANSMPDLYATLLRDPPHPMARYRADVPAELEAVIRRCLQREPEQRYSNVSALAEALLPFAPAAARLHADRARGVLFPSASGSNDQRFGQAAVANEAPEGPSGKTVSSWGSEVWAEKGRTLLWGLVATLFVVGVCFAILELRLEAAGTPPVHAASGPEVAPPVEPVTTRVEREIPAKLTPATEASALAADPKREAKRPRIASARPRADAAPMAAYGGLPDFGGRK